MQAAAEAAAPPAADAAVLTAIRAAPSADECLSAESAAESPLADEPWRRAFRALASDSTFVEGGFGKAAFKLEERWPFAVSSYTMADVERDVTRMPPQFVASGVRHQGGIYNQPFQPGFGFPDVDARMDSATVVLLNAGFCIPKLAAVSLAMLEVTRLPIWMNVYLSKPGLATSTQLHTDTQDVLLVQSTGRKRWRVYRPPPPNTTPAYDPFARGKGVDHMEFVEADLLLDTVMEPGQVLYIPAGFPHTTDTILEPVEDAVASQPSVHLTVGVDTHLWSLSYAHLRQLALARKGMPPTLADGASVTTLPLPRWALLHAPLPVGFLAAQHGAVGAADEEGAALGAARAAKAAEASVERAEAGAPRKVAKEAAIGARKAAKEAAATAASAAKQPTAIEHEQRLCEAISASLAARMLAAEPERWAAHDAPALAAELELRDAARRMLRHHREVLGVQADMYLRATFEEPATPQALRAFTNAMMADMDTLDAHTASLGSWAAGEEEAAKPAGFGGGGGMGAGAKKGAAGKKKPSAKKKRK